MKNGTIFRGSRPINKLYPIEYKKHKYEVIPKFIDERNIPTNIQNNIRDFSFVFIQKLDCLQFRGLAGENVIFGTFSFT